MSAVTTSKAKERLDEGHRPSEPDLMLLIADAWYQDYLKQEEHPVDLKMAVEGAGFRASWAGSCLRRIQYQRMNLGQSNPPSLSDGYRFMLGNDMHDRMQETARGLFDEVEVEMQLPFEVCGDVFGATHIDLVVKDDEFVRPVEIKTIGGFAFKLCATSFKGPPRGPKFNVRRQLAVQTAALLEAGYNVRRGTVIYLGQELVPAKLGEEIAGDHEVGRFSAQWDFSVAELIELAAEQNHEFNLVLQAERANELIPRIIPEWGLNCTVVDVKNQIADEIVDDLIINSHSAWMCGYCPFTETCISHGSIVHVDEVSRD